MDVAGYEHFGEADTGGGYDWAVFGVWLKDGQFWWASDAGCSCNWHWDSMTFPADFEGPGEVHDVIRALMAWKGTCYETAEYEHLLNKLLGYRSDLTSNYRRKLIY